MYQYTYHICSYPYTHIYIYISTIGQSLTKGTCILFTKRERKSKVKERRSVRCGRNSISKRQHNVELCHGSSDR